VSEIVRAFKVLLTMRSIVQKTALARLLTIRIVHLS
jgi:hypothetical protein